MTSHTFKFASILIGMGFLICETEAGLFDYQLPGTSDRDTWNTLNWTSNNNNRYRVGQGNWTSAANAILSNTANNINGPGTGSAFLNTLAANTNGFSPSGTAPAGLTGTGALRITDDIPLAGLQTIVLQLDYSVLHPSSATTPGSAIVGRPFSIDGTLFGGDGVADYFEAFDRTVNHPVGGYPVSAGNYAWQWDLTGFTFDSGNYTIQWSTVQAGTLLTEIQLDQSTQFTQVVGVVPEPTTSALLLGASAFAFTTRLRRKVQT